MAARRDGGLVPSHRQGPSLLRGRKGDDLNLLDVDRARRIANRPYGADAVAREQRPRDPSKLLGWLVDRAIDPRSPAGDRHHDVAPGERLRRRNNDATDRQGREGNHRGLGHDVVIRPLVRFEEQPAVDRFRAEGTKGIRQDGRILPADAAQHWAWGPRREDDRTVRIVVVVERRREASVHLDDGPFIHVAQGTPPRGMAVCENLVRAISRSPADRRQRSDAPSALLVSARASATRSRVQRLFDGHDPADRSPVQARLRAPVKDRVARMGHRVFERTSTLEHATDPGLEGIVDGGGTTPGERANRAASDLTDGEGRAEPPAESQAEGSVPACLPGDARVQADESRVTDEVPVPELANELGGEPGCTETLAGIRVVEPEVDHATRSGRCGLRLPA